MARESGRKSGLRKPHTTINRRILVGAFEQERGDLLEQVKIMTCKAVEEVRQTVHSLRNNLGISLPNLQPTWDVVKTAKPSPSQTIDACDGEKSDVRITVHLDKSEDDTTTVKLEGLGISHLIGISMCSADQASWQTPKSGGMLVLIDTPVTILPALLHDALLDMAMTHAKAQSWSDFRMHLNSHVVANLKAEFVREKNLLDSFSYGTVGECRYFPLAAFARSHTLDNPDFQHGVDLKRYIELWTDFALFVKERTDVQLDVGREHLTAQILQAHIHGGQISQARLYKEIEKLASGHYCLYLLIRRADTQMKIKQLSTFFKKSPSHFRAGWWVIHPREENAKQAAVFLSERYVCVFPFYIGEEL